MNWQAIGPEDLFEFDEDFMAAETEQEYSSIPDGVYQVNVEKVELTRARISGNPMLSWTFKIINPPYRGRLVWRNNVITTQENIKWLKQDLAKCGLNIKKLSELPARLKDLIDITLEISKRTKNEYENIYIKKRIEIDETLLEEDIPF